MAMTFRSATLNDCPILAELNHQLLEDEGHRNRFMQLPQLEQYRAVLFEDNGEIVAYALYREEQDENYLRQLFVARDRRRHGLGREAVEILRSKIWPTGKRLTVDVLVGNTGAIAFWRSVGYQDYCLALEILPDKPASA